MFYRGYAEGVDGREMGSTAKRQRILDQGSPFYLNPTGPPVSSGSGFLYSPAPFGYVGPVSPPFPVVRLRGLPFDCTDVDVAEFFRGLDVVDVLFLRRSGKFSGEAFCVFGYPLQVDFALQRNRQNMGRRYVEVFRSQRQDYYKAIAGEVSSGGGCGGGSDSPPPPAPPPPPRQQRKKVVSRSKSLEGHSRVLKLRGLPFSCGKEDVVEFFRGFDLTEDSVHFTTKSEGRRNGEAFVEFGSLEDSRAAMAKDRMTLGSRYIELFPSSHEELDESLSRGP